MLGVGYFVLYCHKVSSLLSLSRTVVLKYVLPDMSSLVKLWGILTVFQFEKVMERRLGSLRPCLLVLKWVITSNFLFTIGEKQCLPQNDSSTCAESTLRTFPYGLLAWIPKYWFLLLSLPVLVLRIWRRGQQSCWGKLNEEDIPDNFMKPWWVTSRAHQPPGKAFTPRNL